jgi:MFS family permease
MTLLYRVVPAHIYISLCVASWSLIASLQALAGSFSSMFILRAMLGVAEAAFSPGIPFLLYFFFKRDELAVRVGLFISAAALATSFAGSLAWLITKIGDRVAMEKWRSLFLIEGFPGIIVAVVAWYQIPDSPDTARYLSRYERKIARLRLRGEEREEIKTTGDKSKLDWGEIHKALTDRRCWITAVKIHTASLLGPVQD